MITLSEALNGIWITSLWVFIVVASIALGIAAGRIIVWLFQVFFDIW